MLKMKIQPGYSNIFVIPHPRFGLFATILHLIYSVRLNTFLENYAAYPRLKNRDESIQKNY